MRVSLADEVKGRRGLLPRRLGLVGYLDAWELQRQLVPRIAAGDEPETLLLLEHPHTYTIGRGGGRDHLLVDEYQLTARGAALIESDRGGDVTYHGPGQIVGYPLLDLRKRTGGDVHRYLRLLEDVLIEVLARSELEGEREPPYTGVWCRGAKVAAIGVKVSRGVTMHGFALNVDTELSFYDSIIPCGIPGRQVTSMQQLLGRSVTGAGVLAHIERSFLERFEAPLSSVSFDGGTSA